MANDLDYANFANQRSMSEYSRAVADDNAATGQHLQQLKSEQQKDNALTGMKFEFATSQYNLLDKIRMG